MGSVPQTAQENGTSVTKMSVPVTAEEKTNKKNDVKARSLLLMALLNEHQLTFSQYSDAKTMFAAIETRFGDNEATKKTHYSRRFDNNVYAFMVENPNGSNLLQQDLEKIHEDDLEAMDLKWQLSTEYEGKKSVSTIIRWDTFPGNVEHQGTKRVNSEIKTTLGSKETMKTHLQRQCWDIDGVRLTGSVSQKNRTHPNAQRNMVPRAVIMKIGLKPFNTARTVNTAHPKSTVFSAKPMQMMLRPQHVGFGDLPNLIGKPQQHDTGFINSGCSRRMTGNIAYLSDFKEFDGGYVTFGGGAHGGRISGKGTLKTDSLDFEDIDTFYISLNQSEHDSLNSIAGGNFLTKNTQEVLTIIENKSKVQTSRNKPQVASASGSSTQDAHITSLTKQVEALLSLHRPVNSVQNGCETCGGPHTYYECQVAGGYTQEDVYATTSTYNAGGNSYQPQGNRNLLSYQILRIYTLYKYV
ncbi:hypothetical protein Tco_1255644 [Tanacetum coccineum]